MITARRSRRGGANHDRCLMQLELTSLFKADIASALRHFCEHNPDDGIGTLATAEIRTSARS
jgi:hypothetical protein